MFVLRIVKAFVRKSLKAVVFGHLRGSFISAGRSYRHKHPHGTLEFLVGTAAELPSLTDNQDVAVFAVYAPIFPKMYSAYFDLLDKIGFKVVTVVNGTVSEEFVELFAKRSMCVIRRANIGRDFGAYKEFVCHLLRENIEPNRLLICNDSVFANLIPEDERFANFVVANSHQDLVGVAEYMGRPNYHVQSYFLIFSKKVFEGVNFRKFWNNFFITDDRRLNIHRGEVELTQSIIRDGIRPTVFLSTDLLLEKISLKDGTAEDLLSDLRINLHILRESSVLLERLFQLRRNFMELEERVEDVCARLQISLSDIEDERSSYPIAVKYAREQQNDLDAEFKIIIAKFINHYGAVILGSFSNIRVYGFPFLKRDVVYRQMVEWMLIRDRAFGMDDALINDFVSDQRLKKRHWNLKFGRERLAYEIGMS